MKSLVASLRISEWRRLAWQHPEWWTIALSAAAWATIMGQWIVASSHVHGGHADHAARDGSLIVSSVLMLIASSVFMIAAMMFPMVLSSVRTVAARSLWQRRHRAILQFLAGYMAPWMLFSLVVSIALAALQAREIGLSLASSQAAAFGFGAAVLWQLTPVKRRALFACHRTVPIAARGWRADRDCFRSGWMIGNSCVASCWVLMLACMLSEHSLPAMLCATLIGMIERTQFRPNQRLLCSAILLLAVVYVTMPYLSHPH
jgi:predicted metal-binding membrane protein